MLSRRLGCSVLLVAILVAQSAAQAAEPAECPSGMVAGARRPPPSAPDANALASPPISPSMPSDEMAAALERYLSELAAKDDFSGTVLLAKSGKAVFERSYGYANQESKSPNSPATRFNVGSIGKLFTHAAICQLIAKGKLRPSDTIGELLPDYPNAAARPATVEQLLNHTGGIANIFSPDFAGADKSKFQSNDDYYRFVAPRSLTAAPGARVEYCNGCYIVLGAIVAQVSGMPYETYITDNIFKAAGMTGAGFFGPGDDNVAIGYTRSAAGGPPDPTAPLRDNRDFHGVHGSGAGGAYARAEDLLAFDNALRERRLLEHPTPGLLRAPGARLEVGGGAPGVNAVLASNGTWTLIVETNRGPPSAQKVARAITQQLMP